MLPGSFFLQDIISVDKYVLYGHNAWTHPKGFYIERAYVGQFYGQDRASERNTALWEGDKILHQPWQNEGNDHNRLRPYNFHP